MLEFERLTVVLGGGVFIFRQCYNGLRISGAGITVSIDEETGRVDAITNSYMLNFVFNTVPTVSEKEVTQIAMAMYDSIVITREPELLIRGVSAGEINDELKLAWLVYTADGDVCFDANSGDIVYDGTKPVSVSNENFHGNITVNTSLLGNEINASLPINETKNVN